MGENLFILVAKIIFMVVFMASANANENVNKNFVEQDSDNLPRWDLTDLYKSEVDAKADMENLRKMGAQFVENYKGKISSADAELFVAAIIDYERYNTIASRLAHYGYLNYSVATNNPKIVSLHQNIEEFLTDQTSNLIFFSLEVNEMTDENVAKLLQDERIAKYKVWINKIRELKPYQLSEAEELILTKKSVTSNDAWVRLFNDYTTSLKFTIDGEEYTEQEILQLGLDPNRELRKKAALELSRVFKENANVFALITNTLAKDKEIEDNLRGMKHVMQSRNLANNIEDEVVDNLLNSVRENYKNTSHRYYRLKAKLMGMEKLNSWDRIAPLPISANKKYSWSEARELVLSAYADFSPKIAEVGRKFFENGWIDAPIVEGKMSGAFAAYGISEVHPYLMLNYSGDMRDVTTMAHELGHGIHHYLAYKNGNILGRSPLTLAETASVFGEQLTFRKLLKEAEGEERMVLLASKIDSMLATVVRQIAFCLFEKELHERRREGDLSVEDISEIWMRTQKEALGDAVVLEEDYSILWSHIPHFIHTPFYVYSYAFGDCLVNTLYMAYMQTEDKEAFANKYVEMLEAGGSVEYTELLAEFGLNPKDSEFWKKGMSMIEKLIDDLEKMV